MIQLSDPRILLIQRAVSKLSDRRVECDNCNRVAQFNWENRPKSIMCCTLCGTKPGALRLGPMLGIWNRRQPFPTAGRGHTQQSTYPAVAILLDIVMSLSTCTGNPVPIVGLDDPRVRRWVISDECLRPYQPGVTPPASPTNDTTDNHVLQAQAGSQSSSIRRIVAEEMLLDDGYPSFSTGQSIPPYQPPPVIDLSSSTDEQGPCENQCVSRQLVNSVVTSLANLVQQSKADREQFLACFSHLTAKVESVEHRLVQTASAGIGTLTTEENLAFRRPVLATAGSVDTHARANELNNILANYPEHQRPTIRSALVMSPKFRMFCTDGADLQNVSPDTPGCTAIFVRDLPSLMHRLLRAYLRSFMVDTYMIVNISSIGRSVTELLFRDHYVKEAVVRLKKAGFAVMTEDEFDPSVPPAFAEQRADVEAVSRSAYISRLEAIIGRPGLSARARQHYANILRLQQQQSECQVSQVDTGASSAPCQMRQQAVSTTILVPDTQLEDSNSPPLVDVTQEVENEEVAIEPRKRPRLDNVSTEY